jgi:hypothetical protein
MIIRWKLLLAALVALTPARTQAQSVFGGGAPAEPPGDCIPPAQRARIEANIAAYHAAHGGTPIGTQAGPTPYPFFPHAGNLWDELFLYNFVDLDPTSGILDWDGTDWTYDGHRGIDSQLRTFDEQDIGVPVFAALDGTVVDAHDGEFDKNVKWEPMTANYVILWHGGTHYSWYFHLRRASVAVTIGQQVKAGTQIGLTGSSGFSSWPHLHFESHYNGQAYEPFAGPARPGPSYWVHQTTIPRDLSLEAVNVSDAVFNAFPGLPYDYPRKGTFVAGSTQYVGIWILLHNLPLGDTWRVRYLRPDGSVAYDTGTGVFNNPVYWRWAWWWLYSSVNLNVTGTWKVELRINGNVFVQAPFQVVSSFSQIVNHPPGAVTAAFDPPLPTPSDAIFCRVNEPLFHDADYDLVAYRYRWTVNGILVRDVMTAAHADAIPHHSGQPCDLVRCEVTPTDFLSNGTTTVVETMLGSDLKVTISGKITLQSCVNSAQPLTLQFRPACGSAFTRDVTLAGDGSFRVTDIPNSAYSLAIKGSKWLQRVIPVDASGGDVPGVTATLLPGDVNGDNRVNILDLGLLADAFNATPSSSKWNANADLNCDDRVNITDLGLLADNFNKTGDP